MLVLEEAGGALLVPQVVGLGREPVTDVGDPEKNARGAGLGQD